MSDATGKRAHITFKIDINGGKKTYLKTPIYILEAHSLVQSYMQEVYYFHSVSVNLTTSSRKII